MDGTIVGMVGLSEEQNLTLSAQVLIPLMFEVFLYELFMLFS